jgi:hypothetical protein
MTTFPAFGWKFRGKGKTVVILSHETSRCVLGWYSCIRIASLLLKSEPGSLEGEEIKPGVKGRKVRDTYHARWLGKPGGGLNELRLEFKRVAAKEWERVL